MEAFIEILPGIWYEEKTGLPFSTKRNLGPGKGWTTDGDLKRLTSKNRDGYYRVGNEGISKQWHRLVWEFFNGEIPKGIQVDHINNVRSDNRIENLQLLPHNKNSRFRLKHKNNKSGHPGVTWHKPTQKWRAKIGINGKTKHLGYFNDKLEAAEAFRKAKIEYHGSDSLRFL